MQSSSTPEGKIASTNLLIVVDNLHRAEFFKRFAKVCIRIGVKVQFVCYRYSVKKFLQNAGYDCHLLEFSAYKHQAFQSSQYETVLSRSLEVLRGDISLSSATVLAPSIVASLNSFIQERAPTHIAIWNGCQLMERLVAVVARKHNICTGFFEIANIPGRMFVDSLGVNAESSIYKSTSKLDSLPLEISPEAWQADYLKAKSAGGVPQVKAAHKSQWERPLDFIFSKLGYGLYAISLKKLLLRSWNKKFAAKLIKQISDRYAKTSSFGSRDYRFFPLQVTNDTQLLLNSDMGNLDSIGVAVDECSAASIPLVIKIHPAETDLNALASLDRLFALAKGKCEIYVVAEPTEALIQGSSLVYTINSSVGLESLILGKPIKVFGRALYTNFMNAPGLMHSYLQSYLIPLNYFDPTDEVPEASVRMALERFATS